MKIQTVLTASLIASALPAQGPWYEKIGEGCAGTVGTPLLTSEASAVPILGEAFRAQLTNVPDGSAIGILGLSTTNWAGYDLPLDLSTIGMPGCAVYTDVRRASMLSIVGGVASWETLLPNGPEWIGRSFYQQVFVFDDGANGLGAVMSNAREAVISAPQAAPFASIAFPPPNSLTNRETVLVRGRAFDPDGVAELRVNGLLVETSDGYANWQLRVPLVNGSNQLVVEARDLLGNADLSADQAAVESQAPMYGPRGIALDRPRNRILLTDSSTSTVIAVDLTSGKRRVIADASDGPEPIINLPWDIAVDGSRALVLDADDDQLIAIDLLTGTRTLISSITRGVGPIWVSTRSIAVEGSQAFITDASLDALFRVELSTGNRSILTGNGAGSGPEFGGPQAVAIDSAGNRALVTDSRSNALFAVDLSTGVRSIIADRFIGTGQWIISPDDLVIESGRALILGVQRLLSVDLTTGDRTVVSGDGIGSGPELRVDLAGIVLDGSRVLVTEPSSPTEQSQGRVMAIELSDGSRRPYPDLMSGVGEGFIDPVGIAVDGSRALIAHRQLEPFDPTGPFYTNWLGSVFTVDLESGDRTVLSPTTNQPGFGYKNPWSIIIDGDRALATGYAVSSLGNLDGGVFSFNLVTGAATLFARTSTGLGSWINSPIAVARDGDRILILEQGDPRPGLFVLDLAIGVPTILSSDLVGAGPEFGSPRSIVTTHTQALLTDAAFSRVFAVDLTTGDRSLISGSGRGNGPDFDSPASIALDGDRVIVLDNRLGSILSVEILTGDRTAISSSDRGEGPDLFGGTHMAISGEWLLVSNGTLRALMATDLLTGERMILSM